MAGFRSTGAWRSWSAHFIEKPLLLQEGNLVDSLRVLDSATSFCGQGATHAVIAADVWILDSISVGI
jgi:hypothetical protein